VSLFREEGGRGDVALKRRKRKKGEGEIYRDPSPSCSFNIYSVSPLVLVRSSYKVLEEVVDLWEEESAVKRKKKESERGRKRTKEV
jgi:hypothetical protein